MAWASVRCKPQASASQCIAPRCIAAQRRATQCVARHRAPSHLGAHPTTCCRRMSRAGDTSPASPRGASLRIAEPRSASHVTEGPLGAPHPLPL